MSLVFPAVDTQASSSSQVLRYGAYLCLSVPRSERALAARAAVPALAERLGLQNEFYASGEDPLQAIAFLRRADAASGDIADVALEDADAVIHVAAPTAEPVTTFTEQLSELFGSRPRMRVLGGVVRPMNYTSRVMHDFAYAERVMQQPGTSSPNAFIVPMSKTAAWWAKGLLERHTYFLPRFDDTGHMLNQGHALAAEAGIAYLMRRTYKYPSEPAPEGEFDFLTYFECADSAVPTFHAVCSALRDTRRNPEWAYVREGPTWHGRRVATWAELFN
jgi:hypothetical protein